MTSPFDDDLDLHDGAEPIVVADDGFGSFGAGTQKTAAFDAAKSAPAMQAGFGDADHEDAGQEDLFAGHEDTKDDGGFVHMNGDDSHAQDPFASSSDDQHKEPEDVFAAPTALSLWEKERKLVIEERIRTAQAAKAKAQEDAKAEIENFYQQRKDTLAKNQATNRAEEKNTKADMENLMKSGTLWEKVGTLASLQPKPGQQQTKNARMRKLLIQLKNDKVDEPHDK